MQKSVVCSMVAIISLLATAPTQAFEQLSDSQLDAVTAGNASASEENVELLTLDFVRSTRSGATIRGDGTLTLVDAVEAFNLGSLSLSGNAQSNLTALININAVNSPINVLLNLNISIDSTIGSLNQINVTTPRLAPSFGAR